MLNVSHDEPCVVAKLINGITVNGYEFLLDDAGEISVFDNKITAISFLKQSGLTDEEISQLKYFKSYDLLFKDVYEEVS